MQEYQQRVLDEKVELDDKLGRLQKFLDSSTFKTVDPAEQERLKNQAAAMKQYSDILADRLAHF